MNVMEILAREKIKLDEFYREHRTTPNIGTRKVDYGEDDDSGDIFQGREDDEKIIGSHE